MVYNSFQVLLNLFAKILTSIFMIFIYSFFFCTVFAWYLHQGITLFIKWIKKHSFLFQFLKKIGQNQCSFLFQLFVKFSLSLEISFLKGLKVLIQFQYSYRAIQPSISYWVSCGHLYFSRNGSVSPMFLNLCVQSCPFIIFRCFQGLW